MRLFVLAGMLCSLGVVITTGCSSDAPEGPAPSMQGYPLVYSQSFDEGVFMDWELSNPRAWRIERFDGNPVLSLFQRQTSYVPPVVSPQSRAIRRDLVVRDFVLEAKLRTIAPDYPQRDLAVFFGYQDETHFYYAHLAQEASEMEHNVFLVNGADRVPIGFRRTEGLAWDQRWHTVRVVRTVATGAISVYVDDMTTPVLAANDTTFAQGRIGIGSFDDIGVFDDIYVWGAVVDSLAN